MRKKKSNTSIVTVRDAEWDNPTNNQSMKLSKNLLETMAVGIFVTMSISSCELGPNIVHEDIEIAPDFYEEIGDNKDTDEDDDYCDVENCPACGMG